MLFNVTSCIVYGFLTVDWGGYFCRQVMLFKTATRIQANYRGKRFRRQQKAAVRMQCCFRGFRVRWRIWLLKEEWAATLVR